MRLDRRRLPAIRLELLGFGAILVLAALLRLVDLPTRGTWDADQGHDMLVLRDLVEGRAFPLLGPPTSIGDFHHGVLYYVILAPAALVSGSDPLAVTAWIALGGIAAVAVTGWLARAIGGPVAGLLAALILAVSASAVEESVFIWNPNLIALSSSIALAAAWQAWRSRRPGWWVLAGAAAIVTMHCHVLGAILTPVIGGLLIADAGRRRREGSSGAVLRAGAICDGLLAASYLPLLIHEVGTGGTELQALAAFVAGGGSDSGSGVLERLPIVAIRVLGWPLAGLITSAPVVVFAASVLVVGLACWTGWLARGQGWMKAGDARRTAIRWLALGLVWIVAALAVAASSLATVVPGLPNDHYHAFADPMVVVVVAVGLTGLAGGVRGPNRAFLVQLAGTLTAVVVIFALVGWNVARQPPARVADGGWPAADAAARRVIDATGGAPLVLVSLPIFKSDEALRFPLARRGIELAPRSSVSAARVVLCDQLFATVIGRDCGGPAEDAWLVDPASAQSVVASPATDAPARLIDRFEAAPGRWISLYRP